MYILSYFAFSSPSSLVKLTVRKTTTGSILEERLNWTSERVKTYNQRKQNAPVRYFQNDIYTNSDPYFPDEFIVCDNNSKTLRQLCKSGFFVEDLFVNITFSKMQLANFDDIKTKFLSMILNWKVNK